MYRLFIYLEKEVFEKLAELAEKECRDTRQQASFLILQSLQSAQHRLHVDAAIHPQAGASCPNCGNPIILVAPEAPRQ